MEVSRGRGERRRPATLGGRWRLPTGRALPALLLLGWTLLAMAWVWTNPLGAAPDEPDHYVRAVAAGYGDLTGGPGVLKPSDPPGTPNGYRSFTVPGGLGSPPQFACDAFQAAVSAACENGPGSALPSTQVVENTAGTYTPTAYLLPGLVMRLASDPYTALRLGRLASAVLSLSALAVAAMLLWSRARSAFALLGLMLVVTPMQIFLLTELGPNGLEIAAGICFAAGVIRLARPDAVTAWHWAGVAYGAALLAATRPLGPEWIAFGGVMLVALAGRESLRARWRRPSRAAIVAIALVALSMAFNLVWQRLYGVSAPVSLTKAVAGTWANINHFPAKLVEMIGLFGWLDTPLLSPLYALWIIGTVAVAGLALLVATRRQRLLLSGLAVVIVLLGSFVSSYLSLALTQSTTGPGLQGRYLMPLVVWFPLACAEVLHLRRDRLGELDPRRLTVYAAAMIAVVQLGAWWLNSRRYAVGTGGPLLFLKQPQWQPPGGWAVWLLVVLVACAALVGFGVVASRPGGETLGAAAPGQSPRGTATGAATPPAGAPGSA